MDTGQSRRPFGPFRVRVRLAHGNIFQQRPGKQVIILHNHPELAPVVHRIQLAQVDTIHLYFTFCWGQKLTEQLYKRCLAFYPTHRQSRRIHPKLYPGLPLPALLLLRHCRQSTESGTQIAPRSSFSDTLVLHRHFAFLQTNVRNAFLVYLQHA